MIPMVLADKILDMTAEELADILRHIEIEERDLYELLKEKIEDVI